LSSRFGGFDILSPTWSLFDDMPSIVVDEILEIIENKG
jgi:hypothetical protein